MEGGEVIYLRVGLLALLTYQLFHLTFTHIKIEFLRFSHPSNHFLDPFDLITYGLFALKFSLPSPKSISSVPLYENRVRIKFLLQQMTPSHTDLVVTILPPPYFRSYNLPSEPMNP